MDENTDDLAPERVKEENTEHGLKEDVQSSAEEDVKENEQEKLADKLTSEEPAEAASDTDMKEEIEVEVESNDMGERMSEVSESDEGEKSDTASKSRDEKSKSCEKTSPAETCNEKGKSKKEKSLPQLTPRLEYLARPKKDFLDKIIERGLDGSVPEGAPVAWRLLPLQTKIPQSECPLLVTTKKLTSNLFLPTPGKDFDLDDENNLFLPSITYDSYHDPSLKEHFRKKYICNHLQKDGYMTASGRATCSLKDINVYRRYQRRILAAEVRQKLREKDDEFRKKRAEGMNEKITQDMQKYHEKRSQGAMRRWIKSIISSIKDSSMHDQMVRDMRVLNAQIRRQNAQKERVEARKERYQKVYKQHIQKKYDRDDGQRKHHLALARADVELAIQLHERQEKERSIRREKLEEFWKRKYKWQEEWVKHGIELEKLRDQERQKNIQILKKTGALPCIRNLEKKRDSSYKPPDESEADLEKIVDESDAPTVEQSRNGTEANHDLLEKVELQEPKNSEISSELGEKMKKSPSLIESPVDEMDAKSQTSITENIEKSRETEPQKDEKKLKEEPSEDVGTYKPSDESEAALDKTVSEHDAPTLEQPRNGTESNQDLLEKVEMPEPNNSEISSESGKKMKKSSSLIESPVDEMDAKSQTSITENIEKSRETEPQKDEKKLKEEPSEDVGTYKPSDESEAALDKTVSEHDAPTLEQPRNGTESNQDLLEKVEMPEPNNSEISSESGKKMKKSSSLIESPVDEMDAKSQTNITENPEKSRETEPQKDEKKLKEEPSEDVGSSKPSDESEAALEKNVSEPDAPTLEQPRNGTESNHDLLEKDEMPEPNNSEISSESGKKMKKSSSLIESPVDEMDAKSQTSITENIEKSRETEPQKDEKKLKEEPSEDVGTYKPSDESEAALDKTVSEHDAPTLEQPRNGTESNQDLLEKVEMPEPNNSEISSESGKKMKKSSSLIESPVDEMDAKSQTNITENLEKSRETEPQKDEKKLKEEPSEDVGSSKPSDESEAALEKNVSEPDAPTLEQPRNGTESNHDLLEKDEMPEPNNSEISSESGKKMKKSSSLIESPVDEMDAKSQTSITENIEKSRETEPQKDEKKLKEEPSEDVGTYKPSDESEAALDKTVSEHDAPTLEQPRNGTESNHDLLEKVEMPEPNNSEISSESGKKMKKSSSLIESPVDEMDAKSQISITENIEKSRETEPQKDEKKLKEEPSEDVGTYKPSDESEAALDKTVSEHDAPTLEQPRNGTESNHDLLEKVEMPEPNNSEISSESGKKMKKSSSLIESPVDEMDAKSQTSITENIEKSRETETQKDEKKLKEEPNEDVGTYKPSDESEAALDKTVSEHDAPIHEQPRNGTESNHDLLEKVEMPEPNNSEISSESGKKMKKSSSLIESPVDEMDAKSQTSITENIEKSREIEPQKDEKKLKEEPSDES